MKAHRMRKMKCEPEIRKRVQVKRKMSILISAVYLDLRV